MTTDSPKRRWYQYSLRKLLLVMLVLIVPVGWIGNRMNRARNDGRIVAKVRKSHSLHVEYLLGRVVMVESGDMTDADLEHLKGLTNLQALYLSGTKVTDAGLEHLKGLTELEYLYLDNTNITDEGREKLKQALPNCQIRHHW